MFWQFSWPFYQSVFSMLDAGDYPWFLFSCDLVPGKYKVFHLIKCSYLCLNNFHRLQEIGNAVMQYSTSWYWNISLAWFLYSFFHQMVWKAVFLWLHDTKLHQDSINPQSHQTVFPSAALKLLFHINLDAVKQHSKIYICVCIIIIDPIKWTSDVKQFKRINAVIYQVFFCSIQWHELFLLL